MSYIPGVPTASVTPTRILPASPTFDEAFWVAAAEGAVRDYCRWHVAPVQSQTWALDGQGQSRLLLQTGRLIRVTSVVSGGADVTEAVSASESGVIELRGRAFAHGLASVVVTAEHGYYPAEVPAVLGLIASLASRLSDMFGNVVAQQAAGGSSVTFFAGSEHLLAGERAKLDPYRLGGRT